MTHPMIFSATHRVLAVILTAVLTVISSSSTAGLVHRYSFSADASDSASSAHGTLQGGAEISQGEVVFNGAGAFVDLPNGIIFGYSNVTFETWFTDYGSGTWARIFDFGFNNAGEGATGAGTDYLFVTPQSGSGTLRGGLKIIGRAEEMTDWPGTRLPMGSPKHVVWTIDGVNQISRIYVDGVMVGENAAISINPTLLGFTDNNWLGRSQFTPDAWLSGSISEFRIYDTALTAEEVSQNFTYGPEIAANGPVIITSHPQSQTVLEGRPSTFSVIYGGTRPVSVQWLRNNVAIPGETNDTYTIPYTALTQNGAVFKASLSNVYTNTTFTATSTDAALSVTADTVPPQLVRADSLFPSEVLVTFSEAVDPQSATNLGSYSISTPSGSLAVTGARFGDIPSTIILTTQPQAFGTSYTLAVNNVLDLAAAANRIAPDSQATFFANPYLGVSVGNMMTNGVFNPTVSGGVITTSGNGIGDIADQFTFAYRLITNDFDIQVRVASLSFASAWTRAGLMARSSLATNATFSGCFATPGPAGCHFEYRPSQGAKTTMKGFFPVNYPDTWLRLRRTSGTIEGLASLDGKTWESLGAMSFPAESVLHVGFAVSAGNASGITTAVLDNHGPGSGTITSGAPLPFEPLGPSTRRSAIVISEFMYNPAGHWSGTNNLEFIELWNSGLITEDLTGHKLSGDINYQFPDGTKLAPGQFIVVAKDPAAAGQFYGVSCLGPYEEKLPNGGGTLRLLNELGGILLQINYENKLPWPVAADGTGHSLVLSRPSYGEADPRAWAASDVIGGTPGTFEHFGSEPCRGVLINEFLAHTDDPIEDYIELFNSTKATVDLSGAWLTDSASTNKFRIPNGTAIGPGGFLSFQQSTLGFALAAEGEQIFLLNSNQTRVLDAVSFEGQANGVTMGRYPDGASGFQELSSATQGAPNTMPLIRALVINEIMYHPISGLDEDEYVEIYNRASTAAPIGGWQLKGGIRYTFPPNTVVPAGGYIVVGANRANLISKYSQLNVTNTLGDYRGSLKNSGETLLLTMPEDLVTMDAQGRAVTNWIDIVVDEVTYLDGGRWGKWSDGGGSSLELIDPRADNRFPSNWADSDESLKAEWTTISVTNVMENGQSFADEGSSSYGVANRFELFTQGPGEVLVDNIAFFSNNGTDLVSNGDFEAGMTGWTAGGVTRRSYVENGAGIGNSRALHLVAADRGDTGPNKVRSALKSTAATGSTNTGTIRASVRWLKGSPYVLLRIRGNWMEVSRRLNVPSNCGTPGLANSRKVVNAGPAIQNVTHAPILPAAGQPVVVSAHVSDPDGPAVVQLRYRMDPANFYATVTMTNNNGVYRGTIPGMGSNSTVAFTITASDLQGATSTFPANEQGSECLVRWGEAVIPGSIGTYRLWLTSSNINAWTSRERNANDPFDATFVYGNSRVIYNVETMYSGSPFHTPEYNGPLNNIVPDYEVNFKPGELFLGAEPFVLAASDATSGSFFFNDDSAQIDLTGTWIGRKLGQQYNYRRHVHVVMNGQRRGTIYEDSQQPNGDMLDQYYPDDTGRQLRKIESWFEFADDGQIQGSVYARLVRVNTSKGEVDTKRYRWNWRPRATDNPDDWMPFTNLVTVVNDISSPDYEGRVRAWMDVRDYLRPVAVHHICGSWDTYAYKRGKNMYAYSSDNRPWKLLLWDIELALGANSDGPQEPIYTMNDSALARLINNYPVFQREYLAPFQEAVEGPLLPAVVSAILDERYASLQANNVGVIAPSGIKAWIAQRRLYLMNVLPTATFAVTNQGIQNVSGANTFQLGGSAPLGVGTILVNNKAYAVTWTSATQWNVIVPLAAGQNVLNVTAKDRRGNTISGATGSVTVNYTGANVAPEGFVMFNEIQHQPAAAGAAFVELWNAHTNYTFDLSNWRLNGVGYTFPPGSKLPPRSYLVLTENRQVYSQVYGLTNVAFDEFDGKLDPEGETLTLFRPGTGTNEIVVDRVRYESGAPWPAATNGFSLQLVDMAQDNSRVANWGISAPADTPGTVLLPYSDVWKYMQTQNLDGMNWMAPGYSDAAWPSGPGMLAYETSPLQISSQIRTTLANPQTATGNVSPGHAYYFRAPLRITNNPAAYRFNATAYIDDGAVFYVNGFEVTRVRMPAGTVTNLTMATATAGTSGDANTVDSFVIPHWMFTTGTNLVAAEVHQERPSSSDIVFGLQITSTDGLLAKATPNAPNNIATTLPPLSPAWLNEVQPDNATGPADNFSQRDPWAEIINTSSTNLSLAGYYLSDSYTNLTKWAFPAGAFIPPGGYLTVWCDGEPGQSVDGSIHTSFRLPSGSGQLVLSRSFGTSVQVVDYLNYKNVPSNWSYGDVPDAQPFYRRNMFYPTPGSVNNGASAPLTVFINEWMADNINTLQDPVDNNYEDWFELYNPGEEDADVGGYYLTDNLANKLQFRIPSNGHYIVPAGGYLLVWADNEDTQNSTNSADLHASFALSKGGEALGLFAADGTQIDAVTFGAQTTGISEGRYPDGSSTIRAMQTPTPRAANRLPNTPPTLAPINDRTVILGQTLSLTVSGIDTDLPAQTLSYTLVNPPPGASIGLLNGILSWKPQATGTTQITVAVHDDGTPGLSASQGFTVNVVPKPSLTMAGMEGNSLAFTWSSVAGQNYQIEYSDALDGSTWIAPAEGAFTGTGGHLSYTNRVDAGAPERYFRLRILP